MENEPRLINVVISPGSYWEKGFDESFVMTSATLFANPHKNDEYRGDLYAFWDGNKIALCHLTPSNPVAMTQLAWEAGIRVCLANEGNREITVVGMLNYHSMSSDE